MKYYPAYLDLRDRPSLVIGGGSVAERKAMLLLEASARVSVLSPQFTPRLHELASAGSIVLQLKTFEPADVRGYFLVLAATDSPEVNRRAARTCKEQNILVNVAAPPEESTFIVPSVVERGDLLIALSTSGVSPALSRAIRKDLEQRYGPEYASFLSMLAGVRKQLLQTMTNQQARRRVFQSIVDSDILELLRQGNYRMAEEKMEKLAGLPQASLRRSPA